MTARLHRCLLAVAALAFAGVTLGAAIDGDAGAGADLEPAATLLITTEGAGRVAVGPARRSGNPGLCSNDGLSNDYRYPSLDLLARLVDCTRAYDTGSRVTLRAIADRTVPGARFTGWSDYRCGRNPSCTVTVRGELSVTAMFDPVFLFVAEGFFGPVTVSPARPRCEFEADPALRGLRFCRVALPRNTRVALTRRSTAPIRAYWERADGGPRFACEQPNAAADARTCKITLDTSHLVVAGSRRIGTSGNVGEYVRLEYAGPRGGRITIRPARGGGRPTSCHRTCEAFYEHRAEVEIRAVAGRRTRFVRWADANTRSRVRNIRIGTRNPVRAIFARR